VADTPRWAAVVVFGLPCSAQYAAGELFGSAYESQQEPMHQRGLGKAQKIRMQLGGSPNMFEPFPDKPKGIHWRTYDRADACSMMGMMPVGPTSSALSGALR
jgi:hypothetical protein